MKSLPLWSCSEITSLVTLVMLSPPTADEETKIRSALGRGSRNEGRSRLMRVAPHRLARHRPGRRRPRPQTPTTTVRQPRQTRRCSRWNQPGGKGGCGVSQFPEGNEVTSGGARLSAGGLDQAVSQLILRS